MMRIHKGQAFTEYSLLLAIALLAIIAMNTYIKRGLQARGKDIVDFTQAKVVELGVQAIKNDSGLTEAAKQIKEEELNKYPQYEPYYVESQTTANVPKVMNEGVQRGSNITRKPLTDSGPTEVTTDSVEGVKLEGGTVVW